MEQLSSHLAANLAELNARFGRSADFYAKELELYHCKGAIVLFDGMASLKGLWQLLLDAASRRTPPGPAKQLTGEQVFALLFEHSALPAEPAPVENWDALIRRLTAGMAVLLLDGCAKGIAFSVQSLNARSVDEPAGEGNLRGSREGFADLLRVNTSLLRRCFRNDALVIEIGQADCEMKTEYALCYCRDTADPKAVQRCGRPCSGPGRSCFWIPATLCHGSFPVRSAHLLLCAIPNGLLWQRQSCGRGNSSFWSMAAPQR